MKILASLFIILSFVLASVVSIQNKIIVNWYYYLPLFFLGFLGIYILKHLRKKHTQNDAVMCENIDGIDLSLSSICKKFEDFSFNEAELETLNKKIDDTFVGDIDKFLNCRETLKHKFDIKTFADIMSHFAAGERYLNRAWSASVDGYIDEVNLSIYKSKDQFTKALKEFKLAQGN